MNIEINLAEPLPHSALAFGGELKNTVCCAKGEKAWISDPLDDLENADSFDLFIKLISKWPGELGVTPEFIAHDLHPGFISTKIAKRLDLWPDIPRIGVQHHEAHIASCAASENIWDECLGIAFDGTGYGTDGTMWGGEIFTGSIKSGFIRKARLLPIELPGGSAAIHEPWRLAIALANTADIKIKKPDMVTDESWLIVRQMLENPGITNVKASSIGRLFDGVAALLGLCTHAAKEAEAAIEVSEYYSIPFSKNENGLIELDWRTMICQIVNDIRSGIAKEKIAAMFHDSLAQSVFELSMKICNNRQIVIGSGGVFFNKRLTLRLKTLFENADVIFLTPTQLPPSDAGLSFGQAVLGSYKNLNKQ